MSCRHWVCGYINHVDMEGRQKRNCDLYRTIYIEQIVSGGQSGHGPTQAQINFFFPIQHAVLM